MLPDATKTETDNIASRAARRQVNPPPNRNLKTCASDSAFREIPEEHLTKVSTLRTARDSSVTQSNKLGTDTFVPFTPPCTD